jgi:hypothetical protein
VFVDDIFKALELSDENLGIVSLNSIFFHGLPFEFVELRVFL